MCRHLFLFATCCIARMQAQELLPNGGFEQYSACPDYVSQIDRADGWSRPTEGTSDYFNACLGVPFSENVPDNEFGYQPAHGGNGYAGFYCFYSSSGEDVPSDGDHEYVSHALAEPLVPGEVYGVEFFVSLSDVSKYAVNDIGALLSVQRPYRADDLAITATPQFLNSPPAMLDDKNDWARIHGCFRADSAYAWITIGNFHQGAETVYEEVPTDYPLTFYSYYYVDDVSVQHLSRPDLGPDLTICTASTIAVHDPMPGGDYLWSTGETGTAITVEAEGTYSVQLANAQCPLSDTVLVRTGASVTFDLPVDTLMDLCASQHLLLNARPQPPYADVLWSTGDTTATIVVDAAGSYAVHANAPDHCPAAWTTTVIDTCKAPVYVPNAFTPNGDGINDQWRPVWSANAGAFLEWTIFDRWGRVLSVSAGHDAGWDGTASGKPVPHGIYAWRGHAHDPVTQLDLPLSGHITLTR
jgi:gliding motility-associated-like protein